MKSHNYKSLTVIAMTFICYITIGLASANAGPSELDATATKIIASMTQVDNAMQRYVALKGAQPSGISSEDFYSALLAVKILPERIAEVEIVYGDQLWMVWGSKPGTYIMWSPHVSPEVCSNINMITSGDKKIHNVGGMPDPAKKGFQCFDDGNRLNYVIKPVYINN